MSFRNLRRGMCKDADENFLLSGLCSDCGCEKNLYDTHDGLCKLYKFSLHAKASAPRLFVEMT